MMDEMMEYCEHCDEPCDDIRTLYLDHEDGQGAERWLVCENCETELIAEMQEG